MHQKQLTRLDEKQRATSQAMTKSMVNRALHDPTTLLKHEADTRDPYAARMLFCL